MPLCECGRGQCADCPRCGRRVHIGEWYQCPHGPMGSLGMIDDQLPGGPRFVENLGHEPVWVETKSQLDRELKARGLQPFVRHVGAPGSDKSKETVRWV